ncbi:MAG: gliding motility-associated C-terminal domain-containing protein [Bacteroidota bacterium]
MPVQFYLLVFLLVTFGESLMAQPDTLYICEAGDPVQLSGPVGRYVYQWTPRTSLDQSTLANPTATPFEGTLYRVRAIPEVTTNNLIENSDFSAGNVGFTSDYEFVELIITQGVYGVNESAKNLNGIFFEDCPDHTDGTGLMLVVDGSPTPLEKVWCQTVAVKPDTDYAFSAWLSSVNPRNPAELQFSINNVPIGNTFVASSQPCQWRQFYEIWNAGQDTLAEICIVNRNTNPQGNDFALDDFAFYELDEIIYDSTLVLIESHEAARERRVFIPNAFSPNLDGYNDFFQPYFDKGASRILRFQIFDRWGSLVFDQRNCDIGDPNCAWDGRIGGRDAPVGVYLYSISVYFADHETVMYSGDLTLIR